MRSGYLAIVASIIIASLILILISALGLGAFLGRGVISVSHFKEISNALAEGCVDTALLKLAQNPSYGGNETVTINTGETCNILTITTAGSNKVITATAVFQGAETEIKVTVNASTLAVVQWEEL